MEIEGNPEDLFETAQLIDQLRHDDNSLRIKAASSVLRIGIVSCSCKEFYFIASALGPERTRDELVPFIGGLLLSLFSFDEKF